jgi:hypothetical protein
MEHRWGKRSALDIGVRLWLHSEVIGSGRIANVSLSGALVHTACQLSPFNLVIVELESGVLHNTPQRIGAYVVRVAPDGLGLEWCDFGPPAIASVLARTNAALACATRARGRERGTPRFLPICPVAPEGET